MSNGRAGSRTFLMVGLNAPAYRARENNYILCTGNHTYELMLATHKLLFIFTVAKEL